MEALDAPFNNKKTPQSPNPKRKGGGRGGLEQLPVVQRSIERCWRGRGGGRISWLAGNNAYIPGPPGNRFC